MLAAPKVGAPVKWVEDRRENLLAAGQSRHEHADVHDGASTPTARSRPRTSTSSPTAARTRRRGRSMPAAAVGVLFPGPVPRARAPASRPRPSTRTPSAAPRTAGRGSSSRSPARCCSTSRRAQMGIDPVELRRRNLLRRDELPYANPNGMTYDNISPLETFEQALAMLDYDAFRAEQAEARAERPLPRRRACPTTSSRRRPGYGSYAHRGRDDPHRAVGHGQRVHRRRLDREQHRDHRRAAHRRRARRRTSRTSTRSRATPRSPASAPGTAGSRSASMTAGAVRETAAILRERIVAIAAHRLEAAVDDIELAESRATRPRHTRRSASRSREIAALAYFEPASLPPGRPGRPRGERPLHRRAPVDLGERHARVHLRGRRDHRAGARSCATS